MQPIPHDGAKQQQRLQDSHRHGRLHVNSSMLPCVLEHPRYCLGLVALVRHQAGTHQMRITGANTNSATVLSETLSIKSLYLKHRFLSKFVNQKNVKGKRSNFRLVKNALFHLSYFNL